MAPFLALGANALAVTILALAIFYGERFSRTVYMDGKVGPDTETQCLFINDCKAVDVDHCFHNSHIMIIVLALGGVLIVDFTLWVFSLQSTYLAKSTTSPRTGFLALCLGSGPEPRRAQYVDEDDDEDVDEYGMPKVKKQRHEASSLMIALLCALSCASTLALFAPHKTNLNIRNPVSSYPAKDYMHGLATFIRSDDVSNGLSELLIESTAVTRDAAIQYVQAEAGTPYAREMPGGQAETQRTHRIGDTTFQGLRTRGIGVNMASFNEYLLSSRDKLVSLGNSTFSKHKFPSALSRNSAFGQTWMIAPDYQLASLNAKVHGTDMDVTCTDVTSQFTVQWSQPTATDSRKSINWKPMPRASQLLEFDIWSAPLGIYVQVIHTVNDKMHVTPWIDESRRSTDADQYVFVTDSTGNGARAVNVIKCAFSGKDFLTDIEIKHGIMKIRDSVTDVSLLTPEHITATRRAVTHVLENGMIPVAKAIYDARLAQTLSSTGKDRDPELVNRMVQDIFTDLAQAYWSLVRQQVETSIGMWAFNGYPPRLSRYNSGRLLGTYTRLGGSSWGLIMPYLLLILPVAALARLLLSICFDARGGSEEAGSWQRLTQLDEGVVEYDVDFVDSPPPMPPPKDDEEEPPPPYVARSDDVQTIGERP